MRSYISRLVFTVAVATSVVFSAPEWDNLRTTFTKFDLEPRTVEDAKSQGFEVVGSGTCDGSGVYNGIAYAKDDDYSVTLLYDNNGFLVGIQHGISDALALNTTYPSTKLTPPFVAVENRYVITAYFKEPSTICGESRTQQDFDDNGTGQNLWLQTGNTPSQVDAIPKNQSGLAGSDWTLGNCFPGMGVHYWKDVKTDMDCESFFPVFLLYNGGKLNAFGWAFLADLPSPHYEHPPVHVIGAFMKQVPTCIAGIKHQLSTMHIYFTSNPALNNC